MRCRGSAPLLRGLQAAGAGVGGCVFTMDAGHTVRAHAAFIATELLAHYVMTVKVNTPTLFAALDAIDWTQIPVTHETTGSRHGRHETRTIQVTDVPATVDFPYAAQVFLIERLTVRTVYKRAKGSRRLKKTRVRHAVAALGITSLSAREAAPEPPRPSTAARPPMGIRPSVAQRNSPHGPDDLAEARHRDDGAKLTRAFWPAARLISPYSADVRAARSRGAALPIILFSSGRFTAARQVRRKRVWCSAGLARLCPNAETTVLLTAIRAASFSVVLISSYVGASGRSAP
jgi:hypothetical protein